MATVTYKPTVISTADRELLDEIKSRGYTETEHGVESEISAKQGSSLANLLINGGYCWNEGKGETPICSGSQLKLPADCHVTVITPSQDRYSPFVTGG